MVCTFSPTTNTDYSNVVYRLNETTVGVRNTECFLSFTKTNDLFVCNVSFNNSFLQDDCNLIWSTIKSLISKYRKVNLYSIFPCNIKSPLPFKSSICFCKNGKDYSATMTFFGTVI